MKKRSFCFSLFLKSPFTGALLCMLIVAACSQGDQKTYIFLGHPYDWHDGTKIDPRLEKINYSRAFDQVWLGGDVCSRTIEKPSTLIYLDSIFHFKEGRTHWTWGNHDILYGNPERITETTGKPSFYTQWVDGFCLMVLNTNLFWPYPSKPAQEDCAAKKAQMEMMEQLTDTIQKASHLVILHHHALFTELKPKAHTDFFNVNATGMQMTCDSASFLTPWLYERLVKVHKRGVEVVLIGGDFGMRAKKYDYQTPEGIRMLGSGINNSVDRRYAPEYVTTFDPDKVLILHRNTTAKSLNWEFADLDSLVRK